MGKVKIAISSCLLGMPVRYDGGHKKDYRLIEMLQNLVLWEPICPEAECGLPTPREPMRLELRASVSCIVTINTDVDRTDMLNRWAEGRLDELEDVCGFIFKARSPSCGVTDAEITDIEGRSQSKGPGLFARAVMERFPHIPGASEEDLREPEKLEEFIEKARLVTSR